MAEAADLTISQMTLVDWLDDLTVRFLLNLPPAELSSVPRLCFQVEEAQWFYEDFIRPANPALPSLNLRQFCLTLFQHTPLLRNFNTAQHVAAYEEFLAYKVRVPVRGAILMDDSMDKVLLVRGWKKGASWSFPRGKINKDEPDLDCAIREVYEETGFDLNAAGLVERNKIGDGKVKAIDVTMREQHMKLFVFRGVALDTFFEPRTRKEISKIQWYNVKDLPGFKKQKGVAAHGQGEGQSTKFYMVAPFLGHLKKWIGQQRRKDSAAVAQAQHGRTISLSNEGVQATITEDEGEDTEGGFLTDAGMASAARSADELKRLLSIGGAAPGTSASTQGASVQNGAQSNSLLAMLKGNIVAPTGSSLPHTPFEQVDPLIPEQAPRTPQTQHPRHASEADALRHPPPPFEYSPQTLQQGLQQQSQRNPSMFNAGTAMQSQHQQSGLGHLPPHIQQQIFQQQQRQQSLPTNVAPGYMQAPHFDPRPNSIDPQLAQYSPSVQHTHARNNSQQPLPNLHSPSRQPVNLMQPVSFNNVSQQRPLSGHGPPASHAPLVSEKAAPDASKLPPPRLNAHTMKLLDAFKTNPKASQAGSSGNGFARRAGSQQQAALLNLFTKSSASTVPPTAADNAVSSAPISPALTDATEVPRADYRDRTTALNESTRALSSKVTGKSPLMPVEPPQPERNIPRAREEKASSELDDRIERERKRSPQATIPHDVLVERPKAGGQLFDPAHPKKFVRASSQAKQQEIPPSLALKGHPQQTVARANSPKTIAKAPTHSSPKSRAKQPRQENGQSRQPQPVPQFSILQRPGSSRSSAPLSPLRHEAPAPGFQPQVLKREPDQDNHSTTTPQQPNSAGAQQIGGAKKDQLLALFGKSPASSTSAAPAQGPTPAQLLPAAHLHSQPAGHLSNGPADLFHGNHAEITIKTPEPPPSPQLLPEPRKAQQPQHSQQHLLNLFTRPTTSGSGRLNSPGTPISPFSLSTPAANLSMEKLPAAAYDSNTTTPRDPGSRSRLGSVVSGPTSGAQTPTEAKDLLLGYLNGVVQKEGYKGARKPM
ncbi:mRNA decapping complex subunit 2 [Cercospora beticola]|uniref:mRNA decapping complex subunit 2 n=1 Tax=Cercospora beticola TaxID=122368 RepID=A0A2G5I3Y7_CERBT|nr:mRNA decapping complex subunit 2 [Cercospora beticola]PIA99490.1 mRNA decapping complex subunit 2 [Cercospora beticola]WPB00442.1 hypothetical protein RHO25_005061 [Cercospora beticola]CAK1361344.1 unnamed protein product [Cercospora beticola]